jgi:hypothetical protein
MRTTINIDETTAKIAEKVMEKENRNFSNLCEVALNEYCGPRQQGDAHAMVIANAEEIGLDRALELLRAAPRKRKRAA